MNNASFSLAALWSQSDAITHAVAILLIGMSVASWSVMLVKSWRVLRLRKMAMDSRHFWHSQNFDTGLQALGQADGNPFHILARRGAASAAHHAESSDELHGLLSLGDWLESSMGQALEDSARHMQRGLALLASVGSTAPFIGLFGTVWGIYHALSAIGQQNSASLAQVAGPVGEALVMTALGLVVAIPAVLGYNALTRANRELLAQLRRFAHELHAYLISGGRLKKLQAQA